MEITTSLFRIYKSRNFITLLKRFLSCSFSFIYKSRNFITLLKKYKRCSWNFIYKSRNFITLLNISNTLSIILLSTKVEIL